MAQTIQEVATPKNLRQIASKLLNMPLDKAAAVLTARWLNGFQFKSIHSRVSSMVLAQMYRLDPDKTSVVAKNIIAQRKITLDREEHLTDQGWVDLAVEILALGARKVGSVEIIHSTSAISPYTVHATRKIHIVASVDHVNEGILIEIKLDPNHDFAK